MCSIIFISNWFAYTAEIEGIFVEKLFLVIAFYSKKFFLFYCVSSKDVKVIKKLVEHLTFYCASNSAIFCSLMLKQELQVLM